MYKRQDCFDFDSKGNFPSIVVRVDNTNTYKLLNMFYLASCIYTPKGNLVPRVYSAFKMAAAAILKAE